MKRIGLLFLLAGVLSMLLVRGIGFAEDNTQASTQELKSKATVTPAQPQQPETQGTPAIVQPSEPAAVPPVKVTETQESLPAATTELETQWVWAQLRPGWPICRGGRFCWRWCFLRPRWADWGCAGFCDGSCLKIDTDDKRRTGFGVRFRILCQGETSLRWLPVFAPHLRYGQSCNISAP